MTSNNRIVTNLASAIVRLRWWLIGVFSLMLALACGFVGQFRIDASADTLLLKDNTLYIQSQVMDQVFSPEEFILLAYEPSDHPLYSQQTFEDLTYLRQALLKLERVKSVTSMLTVPLVNSAEALNGSTEVGQLTWQQQHYSPQQMRELTEGHPIFTDLLINHSGTATALQIVFADDPKLTALERRITQIQRTLLDGQEELSASQQQKIEQLQQQADPIRLRLTQQRAQEIEQIEAIASEVSQHANTYMGGSYVVGQHLVDIIKSDLRYFGTGIAVAIALLLLILFRSVKWVLFPLLACGVSVLLTMGLFGFLDFRTTVISANFIALQLILTLAVMIHLIGTYRQISRQQSELGQHQRVVATLKDKLAPCFFAALTTSVGFGSLVFSGLQPVMDFGWMMLVAMLVSMGVSLLLFPALLSLLPASKESQEYPWVESVLGKLNQWSLSYRKTIIVTVLLVMGGLAAGASRLSVENSFIDYFADTTQVHKELTFIDQEFGGSTPLDIVLSIDPQNSKDDLVLSAHTLNKLQLVQEVVKAFDATGSVTSVANFTELARQVNNGKPLTEYELTAIYHVLDEQVVNQLVGGYLSVEDGKLRIAARIQDTTPGLDREAMMRDLRADLGNLGLTNGDYQLTNLFVLYQDILARLFDSQVTTLGIVYALLGLVMLLIFRSLKIALIALVPNVLTTLGILGLIGWLGLPLDIMTITIAAIAMGIAVDDTIHFVHAWQQGYQRNDDRARGFKALREQGSAYAFKHAGVAILFTTTVIAVGFSLFGYSDFLPSVYFGLFTCGAMLMALITDMTLLPAMLNSWGGRQSRPESD